MVGAKNVLLATNAYTSHLLPGFTDFIVPTRGQMAALTPRQNLKGKYSLSGVHSYLFLGDETQNTIGNEYLRQRPTSVESRARVSGGRLILGGGRRLGVGAGVGVSDDSELDGLVRDYLRDTLNDVLDIEDSSSLTRTPLEPEYEWTGIMGFSADVCPWVGAVPQGMGGGSGLWVCAGFTGHGMPNAALCAKAVVEMMMGRVAGERDLPLEYRVVKERVDSLRKKAI